MANDTGNRSDSIVYLTLVDFLIQLIFFGMFLFVAFYPSKSQDEPTLKTEFKNYGVPILEGFGELINAENVTIFQTLAEYIRDRKDLIDLVEAIKLAGSISKLLEVNQIVDGAGGVESARKRLGVGQPACIKGKLSLMTVVAHDDFIQIKEITDVGRVVFAELGLRLIQGDQFSFDQFTNHFKLLVQQKIDEQTCVHFVRYERLTKLEAPRLAVDRIFLIGR